MHIIRGVKDELGGIVCLPQPTQTLDKVNFLNLNPTLNSIRHEFNKNEAIQIQDLIGSHT